MVPPEIMSQWHRAVNDKLEEHNIKNKELLVSLPFSIISSNFTSMFIRQEIPNFTCPNRKELHDVCVQHANWFDKLTVPPVNASLHKEKVPLTQQSLYALKQDIISTKEMSPSIFDPLSKQVNDYKKQALNQTEIAKSFKEAGEHEGALLHYTLSDVFELKARVAQKALEFSEAMPTISRGNNKS